jgi:hypothetical protein
MRLFNSIKKYYRVCANCSLDTENKILLCVFLAHDGKISVGCLVIIDEKTGQKLSWREEYTWRVMETSCSH